MLHSLILMKKNTRYLDIVHFTCLKLLVKLFLWMHYDVRKCDYIQYSNNSDIIQFTHLKLLAKLILLTNYDVIL